MFPPTAYSAHLHSPTFNTINKYYIYYYKPHQPTIPSQGLTLKASGFGFLHRGQFTYQLSCQIQISLPH